MGSQEWEAANKHRIAAYKRKHYEANKATVKKKAAEHRQRVKDEFFALKATLKCVRCGESHPACLDFHHRDASQKDGAIGQMVTRFGWSIKRIEAEIAKCDVLCANCHRKHHFEERLSAK